MSTEFFCYPKELGLNSTLQLAFSKKQTETFLGENNLKQCEFNLDYRVYLLLLDFFQSSEFKFLYVTNVRQKINLVKSFGSKHKIKEET